MSDFTTAGLWQRTLGQTGAAAGLPLATLQAAYSVFRERVSALTAQIARALPNLTIHDVTHLDALWETADLIAGSDYPLNPAEGFVFGGAVLLHDAALCFEAYEGGQAGLRQTVEWKDAFAAIRARHPSGQVGDAQDEADFAAMRLLHATRAAELGHSSWRTPEGESLFLIESAELRKHYGRVIGDIAASHHWPIEDVLSKLPSQINALPSMPRDWSVDPVKLACLLRCADAAHIDSRRAPDFLRALGSLHGVSAQHWTAQNWLERVDIDRSDPTGTSILFTSGRSFDEGNADAWWVAYDAIGLVDRELAASAQLLEGRPQSPTSPPFKMTRVTGAASPLIAAKSISTSGWIPHGVEIHVSNLEKLITELGGEKLYGDGQTLPIVLRELVQNARDAVVARRALDPEYRGRIRVIVRQEEGQNVLYVEDDGVGMSRRVITGPLLDFGASFWASDLARSELPGLLSSGYRSVGRFGIGFYSTFMVATALSIASRRFDAGVDDTTQIRFPRGLSLRPIVSKGPPKGFGYNNSTVVRVVLKSELGNPESILVYQGRPGYDPELRIPLNQCMAILCAGLDVDVDLVSGQGPARSIHLPLEGIDTEDKRLRWLRDISGQVSDSTAAFLDEHARRLRPIRAGDAVVGLAALSTGQISERRSLASVTTVGGLATSISMSDLTRFVGCIDYAPNSAKRDPSQTPSGGIEAIDSWLAEQKTLLPPFASDPMAWCFATCSISDLGGDPIDVASVVVRDGDQFGVYQIAALIDLITRRGLAFYQSNMVPHVETHHSLGIFQGMPTFWPIRNSAFLSLDRDESGVPVRTSVLSCIFRRADEMGVKLAEQIIPNAVRGHFGPLPVRLLTRSSSS